MYWLLILYLTLMRKNETAYLYAKKPANPPGLTSVPERKRNTQDQQSILKYCIYHLLTFTLYLLLFIQEKAKTEIPLEDKTYGNARELVQIFKNSVSFNHNILHTRYISQ